MEIYRNSNDREVHIDVPVLPREDSIEVTIFSGDTLLHTVSTVTYDPTLQRYSFTLPFFLTQNDQTLRVNWKFVYEEDAKVYEYNDDQEVNVVTSIIPIIEIKKILGEDATDEEAVEVEKSVRQIIQAHTGQFFGRFSGKRSVTGSGEEFLRLPMKLIALNSLNGNQYVNNEVTVRGSGWFLQSKSYSVPSIRADDHGWHMGRYSGQVPIVAPYTKSTVQFIKNAEYVIDGVWGWKSIPEQVKEAARLLVNDYACGEIAYRDRFLVSMTAADWRIQFHDNAFANTGNVRANQLLAEFVLRRGWVIL